MNKNNYLSTIILLSAALSAQAGGIRNIRVEYQKAPVVTDAVYPRFSWQMTTDTLQHNQRQKAWQIVVTDEKGRQVWDSGRTVSDQSLNIVYNGSPLQPATVYRWMLNVWDNKGEKTSGEGHFETGLMGNGNWSGAQWIGAGTDELPLYAPYLPVFRISYTVKLDNKSRRPRASFIYGANDPRLESKDRNILNVAMKKDSSYIRVELDASADTARLNIYRTGYTPGDRADKPLESFAIPQELINRQNRHQRHTISFSSVLGTTTYYIDGSGKPVGKVELNPMGRGGDFIAFPMLGDYGFQVPDGQQAAFSNVEVRNFRSPANKIKTLAADTLITAGGIRTSRIEGLSEPMLRTTFKTRKGINRARLYVTARGAYDAFVNGHRVSDGYLNPGLTQYNKTHLYQTYDVTSFIREGDNAVGVQLSEGWWRGGITFVGENWNAFGDCSSLLAMLDITYEDGSRQTITTNPDTWKSCSEGPLRAGSIFQGEVTDGLREKATEGWTTPGYDDSSWDRACIIPLEGRTSDTGTADMPAPDNYADFTLMAQPDCSVTAVDTLTAISVEEVRPGVYVYDMGQNMAGVPLVTLNDIAAGKTLKLRFAEVKYPALKRYAGNEGMIMLENIRAAMAQDIYICRGGKETFSPRFTYHGYRYVEITGIDAPLPLDAVKGIVLSSVNTFTADYTTTDQDVNRLWKNIQWSMRANFFSIPTDCPQRNERMGWSGDISVFSPTATYMADVASFLDRHTRAMRDVQRADGKFLDIAPIGFGFGGLLWGSAGIIVPWQCWLQYADRRVLEENYENMGRYIDFIEKNAIDHKTGIIVQRKAWGDLGDWLSPEDDRNDRSLLWEAYYIHDLEIMAKVAGILGKTADEEKYKTAAASRRAFFIKTYLEPETARTIWSDFDAKKKGTLVNTETSYVLPLAFDIVSGSMKTALSNNLKEVMTRPDSRYRACPLLTGFIGTAWISDVLSDCGLGDLAYKLLLNRSYPSWLYPVTQGATTIWERLNSYTHTEGFGSNNRMNSFNHYSFGAVGEWMVSRSLGIRRDEAVPGFKHFILAPQPDPTGSMTSAQGYYDSMYGRIESAWTTAENGTTTYAFTIPANTSATLLLKGHKLKGNTRGMDIKDRKNGIITATITSGKYKFTVK